LQHMVIEELLKKIGIDVTPIKSAGSKDIGSPYREMTTEERQFFHDLISSFHNRFVGIVADGRGLHEDKVRTLASGKVFTAEQSKEYGLIDEIGYFDSALDKIKALTDIDSPTIIEYNEPFDIKKALRRFSKLNSSGSLANEAEILIRSLIEEAITPEVKALWTGE